MATPEQDFSFRRRLARETESWLSEGLITPEQREKILSRYRVLAEAEEKAAPGRLITTISILGAVMVGVGVILFIAANWSEVPRWGKLCLIFGAMITAYGLGFWLRYEKEDYPKVGAALIFLGALVFGAGIFLIAQIYHITVHYPNGPLLWGLGVFPLAYLLRFRTVLSLAILDILIWLGMEASFHVAGDVARYGNELVYIALFLLAGISLWGTGIMHRSWNALRPLSSPYVVIGACVSFSAGYVFTFDVFRGTFGSAGLFPFYLGVVLLFLLSMVVVVVSREKERGWLAEAGGLSFVMALSLGLALLYSGMPRGESYLTAMKTITLASNIVFAVAIIGVIVLGYMRRYTPYINIGLLFFVLDVIARYFDFFWKLLPRSVFFIAGGLILLSGGVFLEKKRRKVLASFNMREAD
jgi:uncharacterized membrane protein